MLGGVLTPIDLPIKLIPAVTWKSAIKREGVDLKEVYRKCRAQPHQVDATLIGVYVGLYAFKLKGFKGSNISKLMPGIIKQIEDTSLNRLVNRRP